MPHLNTTWHHMRRSPYQAFAAVFILTQTFFVILLFTFLVLGSAKIISYLESKPRISVYFDNAATQSDIKKLQTTLQQTGKIGSIKYISKQQALSIYKQQNKNDPILLELVTPDTLPASLEISVANIGDLPAIAKLIKRYPINTEVIFQADVVNKLTGWTSALRKIGLGLSIIFILDSIFIMVIIIGIKVSQKREEIEIMKLIGATNWYISLPFVLEGISYGIIGALLGWVFASITLLYASGFLISFLGDVPIFPIPPMFFIEILLAELLLAVFLGALSSYIAVIRYLK